LRIPYVKTAMQYYLITYMWVDFYHNLATLPSVSSEVEFLVIVRKFIEPEAYHKFFPSVQFHVRLFITIQMAECYCSEEGSP
jgi:hypothetical protein